MDLFNNIFFYATHFKSSPSTTIRGLYNMVDEDISRLMLGQRRRRWTNIKSTFGQRLV